MKSYCRHYIAGHWVTTDGGRTAPVINPATEEPVAELVLGSRADVDRAVSAAEAAFAGWSMTSVDERLAALDAIYQGYKARTGEIAASISAEMGCPISLARSAQVGAGIGHFKATIAALQGFAFEEAVRGNLVVHEPIGVVALITPWNWPMNQIIAKLAPALAAGNCVVLKPSEQSPGSATILAEVIAAAGLPAGVFNLVHGTGAEVGEALSCHPGVAMVSFTGSTRAGILVAKAAADSVKRVHQELGGKSPNILLPGVDLEQAVPAGIARVMMNSGQSCIAPARMLVHDSQYDHTVDVARRSVGDIHVGDPAAEGRHIGPVVSKVQYDKIQGLIESAIADGATVVTGGPGRPEGFNRGYYVRPTVFSDVTPAMRIAREEIFGPVLTLMRYGTLDEAVAIANDTDYGLSAVISGDEVVARRIAPRLRAGVIYVNGGNAESDMPFGGYKQSGNGREHGRWGLAEFMEVKSVIFG